MRFLVTGCAGFIGSHIVDRLLADGHYVDGIDNFQTGRPENLAHHFPDGRSSPGAEHGCGNHGNGNFWKGDIAGPWYTWLFNGDGMETVIGDPPVAQSLSPIAAGAGPRPDVIIHCAASYDDRLKWHRDTETNVKGAINVGIAAREWGCRVVYFQTALIYGNNPRDWDGFLERWKPPQEPLSVDDTHINPENSYAISKYAGEQYLRHADVPLLTLRLANIYGPRNLSGPVPTFYKRITEGQPCTVVASRRDFVYVDDLVDLVVQAIDQEATGTYHVSTGRDYAIGQLYSAVCDALDRQDVGVVETTPRGADDAPTILLDPSETQRAFGWQATTDLDEGVERAVDWYRENGVERTFTHLAVKG